MKILAIERSPDGVDWTQAQSILREEARQVYQLYLNESIREIFFTENQDAILILESESREAAAAILESLPLVSAGMIRFDLMELHPYTGYGRIMNL